MSFTNPYPLQHFAILLGELETNSFTGKVSGQSGERSCELYFTAGQLVHASSDNAIGEDVVYDMLGWKSGLLKLAVQPATLEHSLDVNQLALLRETVQLFQTKGIFDLPAELANSPEPPAPNEPSIKTTTALPTEKLVPALIVEQVGEPKQPEPVPTQSGYEPLFQAMGRPVEWGVKLELAVTTTAAPPKPAKKSSAIIAIPSVVLPPVPATLAETTVELEQPVSIGLSVSADVTSRPHKPEVKALKPTEVKKPALPQNIFSHYLPPGRAAEPTTRHQSLKLVELVRRVATNWPNSYVLLSNPLGMAALLLIEQGKLTAVRYAKNDLILKGQAAFDQLQIAVTKEPSELSIFASDVRLLGCYRTLIGGNHLLTGTPAHTLDIAALMRQQVGHKTTVAFRFHSESTIFFYLIYQGEVLGSFQVKNNTMARSIDPAWMTQLNTFRLDLLEISAPESIELEPGRSLQPAQTSLLTEAASCVLQLLGTLSGEQKVLASAQKVLEGATGLFPCLQRLGVGMHGHRPTFNWTLDHTQGFVTREEAQTAINFLLVALLSQHDNLLSQQTMRELARRALEKGGIDLKKERLTLDCLI